MNEHPSLETATSGSIRFNTDSRRLEIYNGEQWFEIDATSPEEQTGGTTGMILGGYSNQGAGNSYGINSTPGNQFINISTTGNAATFGTLSGSDRYGAGAASDRTRAMLLAGQLNAPNADTASNIISFVTMSSRGNAEDFGDLTPQSKMSGTKGILGNSTRGVHAGMRVANMDYVTIQSTGNGISFGDLLVTEQRQSAAGFSSPTRAMIAGGGYNSNVNNISYFTTSTLGDTADFGDLAVIADNSAGCSNAVRGILSGGNVPSQTNAIEFITTATLGNALDFGDSTVAMRSKGACSSPTRAVAFGGSDNAVNTIDYVQIMTTGNAIDFGDLNEVNEGPAGASNGHGALG